MNESAPQAPEYFHAHGLMALPAKQEVNFGIGNNGPKIFPSLFWRVRDTKEIERRTTIHANLLCASLRQPATPNQPMQPTPKVFASGLAPRQLPD
jgi:hypothetical protein